MLRQNSDGSDAVYEMRHLFPGNTGKLGKAS